MALSLNNTVDAWGWPARLLHWAMAAVILFMLGLGIYMADFVTDTYAQFDLIQIHKSWGFVAFVLALIRVVWRATHKPAPALPQTPHLQHLAAEGAHLALYVLMFLMPLSGWLMASASPLQDSYGIKNMVFGLFAMPDPFQPGSSALEGVFSTIHGLGGWAMIAILAIHAAAALYHHFVVKDATLRRMTSGR